MNILLFSQFMKQKFKRKAFFELYFSDKYVLVQERNALDPCCHGWLDVGNTELNSVDACGAKVEEEPSCSKSFFYAPSYGWCICEEKGYSCTRSTNFNPNYNEYSVIVGA